MISCVVTHPFFALYEVEQLSLFCVLQYNENVTACIDKFEVLDNVRMIETAQNLDFPLHFFEYSLHFNFALVQNFDSNLVLSDFIDRHYRKGEID